MKQRVLQLKKRYEHIIMPIALIGGFVIDIFTLNQIDQTFDNAILIAHLILAGVTICLLFSRGTHFGRKFLTEQRIRFIQTVMVFSFGALFSGFVIFYTRSGSLLTSWPFIVTMLALMLSTEFKKKYFARLRLQILVFVMAVLSWSIFFVPVVIKKMGPWIFILSSLVTVILIILFFLLLNRINEHRFRTHRKKLIANSIGILLLFNLLYFTNIMPPIPLSLKFQAAYYDIERLSPGYRAQYEATPWYIFWNKRSRSLYWRTGEDLFVFTQVFAPTKLETHINHVWQYYDSTKRHWETRSTIPLSIAGGRKDGYRGFSKKESLEYGLWRVRTETPNGQTLGIISFHIKPYDNNIGNLVYEEL
ncbi:DUF2914 domain-containing protein [Patescibacteria group bacterium]|nr:DUF2914 domain-containing protein [Patescibacteria group bacterium]